MGARGKSRREPRVSFCQRTMSLFSKGYFALLFHPQTRCQATSPVPSTCHSPLSWMPLGNGWEQRTCPNCSARLGWMWRNPCGPPVALVSQHATVFWLLTCSGTLGCVFMTAPGLSGLKGLLQIWSSHRGSRGEWKRKGSKQIEAIYLIILVTPYNEKPFAINSFPEIVIFCSTLL